VERRLAEERDRLLHYLEPSTRRPLISCVERQFLLANVSTLLAKGFDELMDGNRFEDLQRMHRLFTLPEVGAQEALLTCC
jgi:cullin-4